MSFPLSYFIRVTFFSFFLSVNFHSIQAQQDSSSANYGLIKYDNSVLDNGIYLEGSYLSKIEKDQFFFVIDSSTYVCHQSIVSYTDSSDYKGFALSLKYYPDNSLRVFYQPTVAKNKIIGSPMGYLDSLSIFKSTTVLLRDPLDLNSQSEKLFISKPELVEFVWKTIPEPHRMITDRKYLNNRSAEEGIAILLDYDRYETKKKLEKRVRKTGPWYTGGTENLQLSQTHLSNWTKGGENSISIQSDLILKANYTKDKVEWENHIRHKLGIVSSETDAAQISTDQIEFFNKYGIKASQKWYYSLVSNFKSQLFNAYASNEKEEVVSTFLSPAYITFSLGMDYKPNENFTLLLSPLSIRFTYVNDTVKVDQTRYQVDADKKSSFHKGLAVLNTYKWEISTELQLTSNLDAFIGYETKQEFYQVDWELIFDMRINRYLSTRINTQFRYFTNESNNLQFREYFAVGFNYDF